MTPISTFLDGSDPNQLRGLAWLALSDSGNVLTATVAGDTGGGGTTTWSAGGTVPCRVDSLTRGHPGVTGGAIDERSTHIITLPSGTGVVPANRFVVAGQGTFEVTAVRHRTAAMTQVIEVTEAF